MFLAFLLAALFFLLPGLLLHVLWRERGWTLAVCIGFSLAILLVVDSCLAALAGYRFWLQVSVEAAGLIGLAWAGRRRLSVWWEWLRLQWPWPAAGWFGCAAVFIVPAFVVPFPFDTDAQGFAYLTLTTRLGGTINSLAPFWPNIKYFYSPGLMMLGAQLADALPGGATDTAVTALGHLLAVCVLGGIYSVGRDYGGERVGGWAAFFGLAGYALFSSLMDSAYTTLLGLLVAAVFLVLGFRAFQTPGRFNLAVAAVALAAVPLAHADMIIQLLMAYLPFYATVWLARERPRWPQYLAITALVPAVAVALCLPWVSQWLPLLGGVHVHQRIDPSPVLLSFIFTLNGWLTPILALAGVVVALRRRSWQDVWMVGWLVMILEVAVLGHINELSKRTAADPMQIVYTFGVAWHAGIIPFACLAALAVCAWPGLARITPPPAWRAAGGLALAIAAVTAGLLSGVILPLTKGHVSLVGALSSSADRQAMLWLKANTPPDAYILNYPGIEGDWAPVVSERKTVEFREQSFYIGAAPVWALQGQLRTAFLDPAAPVSGEAIRAAGIDYVLVPQVIGRPGSLAEAMRWRPPFVQPQRSSFADAPYLSLVKDFDGAQIWKVIR